MTRNPNNFPREGQHTPVTRAGLERLKAERPKRNTALDYTIGGTVEAVVHSSLDAEREAAITTGERRLADVSTGIRRNFPKPGHECLAAYIRAQQQTAANAPQPVRVRGPKR
ncbi:MAG: hypothetical protein AAGJ28_00375 [Pseudomonadota bacterium]